MLVFLLYLLGYLAKPCRPLQRPVRPAGFLGLLGFLVAFWAALVSGRPLVRLFIAPSWRSGLWRTRAGGSRSSQSLFLMRSLVALFSVATLRAIYQAAAAALLASRGCGLARPCTTFRRRPLRCGGVAGRMLFTGRGMPVNPSLHEELGAPSMLGRRAMYESR